MDVDMQDVQVEEVQPQTIPSGRTEGKKPMTVPVDEAHPFELDSYITPYTGRGSIYRLCHILQLAPSCRDTAFTHAVQRIIMGRDTHFFTTAVTIYNQHADAENQKAVDTAWVEELNAKNTSERSKLEVELKTYQSNMIKESIRMAHRDLGNFYRAVGDDSSALKHYTKSREYCTASQHVLDMCISVLELLIEQRNYPHITTYVFKAEAALEVATAGTSSNNNASGALLHKEGTGQKKVPHSAEREKVQTKLEVATGLSHLGQAFYEKAASVFLKIGQPKGLSDWNGKIITPSDIAIYGTLCALATMSRSAIKTLLAENTTFGLYLEHEPYARDLVDAYMGSKFKTVLDILEQYSTRHYIDIHLFAHIHDLTNLIRDRALVLYFQPFASIKLERMALAFGLGTDELEKLVVALIKCNEIKGRVDSRNKIVKAKVVDQRIALFARAALAGAQMESTNRKLLLRMRLQQADLIVKAPRQQTQQSGSAMEAILMAD